MENDGNGQSHNSANPLDGFFLKEKADSLPEAWQGELTIRIQFRLTFETQDWECGEQDLPHREKSLPLLFFPWMSVSHMHTYLPCITLVHTHFFRITELEETMKVI